jgi:hypothetical protein
MRKRLNDKYVCIRDLCKQHIVGTATPKMKVLNSISVQFVVAAARSQGRGAAAELSRMTGAGSSSGAPVLPALDPILFT